MPSNNLIAFLILFLVQIAGFRTGMMLILYKDTMWRTHLRNARMNPQQYVKPAIWNPMLNMVGIFLIIGNLLLFTTAVEFFWA